MGMSWPSETWKAFTSRYFLGMILAGLGGGRTRDSATHVWQDAPGGARFAPTKWRRWGVARLFAAFLYGVQTDDVATFVSRRWGWEWWC